MAKEENKIRICDNHTKRVPLIWTFKFLGAEYWCPYCGFEGGMLGSGRVVNATQRLIDEAIKWKEEAKSFLSDDTGEVKWTYKHESSPF